MSGSWKQQGMVKTDYDRYHYSVPEKMGCLFKSAAITGVFAYMFYRSWIGFLALPAVVFLEWKRGSKRKIRLRKERLSIQFKDTIEAAMSGMQAGYSVENAFLEAEKEICSLYGSSSEMAEELAFIRKGLKNKIPLEQMLVSLGQRSHVDEIRDFTEVFSIAKRMGGNMKEIISRTAELTRQRLEVEREIATTLAAQKYEQKVMSLIPFLLFGYLSLSSRGFFDILYHNAAGVLFMTAALLLYLASWMLSERIMDIRV